MYNLKNRLLSTSLLTFLVACGPVKSRIHPSPALEIAQQTMREQTIQHAKVNTFVYQPETRDCRNAKGMKGYNIGAFGPCALLTEVNLIPEKIPETGIDLKGSVLFNVNLKDNTSFKNADLEDTTWVNVTGKRINFDQAKLSRAQFHHCTITDQHDKPVQ